jgi:hypothetical protein
MTDTVLQSFCERCGTRYTFTEQDTRRESGLSKIGRSLGLRSAPKPAGEPTVADALPTHDPFRATFHFCLECRQYTCQNCWNPDAGFCQTCYPLGEVAAPAAGNEVSAAGYAFAAEASAAGPSLAAPTAGTAPPTETAWPTTDLERTTPATRDTEEAWQEEAAAPIEWAAGGQAAAETPARDPWGDALAQPAIEHDRSDAGATEAWPVAEGTSADGAVAQEAPDVEALAESVTAEAPAEVLDPWRGVVFSTDESEVAASELADAQPQLDPELPWLSHRDEVVPETAAESDEIVPATDEAVAPTSVEGGPDASDIDHRGWIAASTIASASAWSPPVPPWPDEASASAASEVAAAADGGWTTGQALEAADEVLEAADEALETGERDPWGRPAIDDEVGRAEPTLESDAEPAVHGEPVVAWIVSDDATDDETDDIVDATSAIEAGGIPEAGAPAVLGTDDVILDDGPALRIDRWPDDIEEELAAWPAADTLPPTAATPAIDSTGDAAPAPEWLARLSPASDDEPELDQVAEADEPELDQVAEADEPELDQVAEADEPELDQVAEPVVLEPAIQSVDPTALAPEEAAPATWTTPLPAQLGVPYAPAGYGPFAGPSPLAPDPVGPTGAPPAPILPPMAPRPPVVPTYAAAARLPAEPQPPVAPLPPVGSPSLGMLPPPPLGMPPVAPVAPMAAAPAALAAPAAFVAPPAALPPLPPLPGIGLQAPAASAPTAAAAGPAGPAKARPCQSCQLPLSAKARFCRRCGAQQPA